MFNTAEKYIKAMLDGRRFISYNNKITYFDPNSSRFRVTFTDDICTGFEDDFSEFRVVREVFDNWYDDSNNKGKWCWFWDVCTYSRVLGSFKGYHENSTFPFCCGNHKQYCNAKLLTEEEVEAIIKASPELVL